MKVQIILSIYKCTYICKYNMPISLKLTINWSAKYFIMQLNRQLNYNHLSEHMKKASHLTFIVSERIILSIRCEIPVLKRFTCLWFIYLKFPIYLRVLITDIPSYTLPLFLQQLYIFTITSIDYLNPLSYVSFAFKITLYWAQWHVDPDSRR